MYEPPKPIKKRWIVTIAAAVGSVTGLIVENVHVIDAITRFLRSITH